VARSGYGSPLSSSRLRRRPDARYALSETIIPFLSLAVPSRQLSRLESASLTMVTTESEQARADSRTFATLGHAHESITAKRNALHCPRWG
jgi:hypothetical protein